MAFTAAEEIRLKAIEEMLNTLQTAIANTMSKQQMRQLLLVKQKEVDELTTRVAALESQITVLQGTLT